MNEEMLIEIWLMTSGYMEKAHIETAAEHFIGLLSEYTDDIAVFNSMKGADPYLDTAIAEYVSTAVGEDIVYADEYLDEEI